MRPSDLTLWSLFLAAALSVGILVVAFGAAVVIAQRRRLALEREHARRVLEAQEAERARVARELHDDALQRVAMIRNEVDGLAASVPTLAPDAHVLRLGAVAAEIEDLGVTLRNAAHQLHPSIVEKVGLARALESLAAEFERTAGLRVSVTVAPDGVQLSPEASVSAYRIAQEALRNVVKHARVASATVSLSARDGAVILRVSDAGAGFEPGAKRSAAGLGLIAMQQRAELIHGHLSVTSHPGAGTTVRALFPGRASR